MSLWARTQITHHHHHHRPFGWSRFTPAFTVECQPVTAMYNELAACVALTSWRLRGGCCQVLCLPPVGARKSTVPAWMLVFCNKTRRQRLMDCVDFSVLLQYHAIYRDFKNVFSRLHGYRYDCVCVDANSDVRAAAVFPWKFSRVMTEENLFPPRSFDLDIERQAMTSVQLDASRVQSRFRYQIILE